MLHRMASDADVVAMTSTSAPIPTTTPTARLLVKVAAVLAAVTLAFCAWSMWQSNEADTVRRQDCIVAMGRYAAAGRPSHITAPDCQ